MKRRTRQQLVDPWSIPPKEPIEVYVVEDEQNITEEVELTLEHMKSAFDLTTEEIKKIWADHREKNER
tara:strand:+ start:357 stop:560 length:204 start_codon:yes stop_codon:yes gene_type:complete